LDDFPSGRKIFIIHFFRIDFFEERKKKEHPKTDKWCDIDRISTSIGVDLSGIVPVSWDFFWKAWIKIVGACKHACNDEKFDDEVFHNGEGLERLEGLGGLEKLRRLEYFDCLGR